MKTTKVPGAGLAVIFLAVILTGCTLPPSGRGTAVEVGKAAPPFKLRSLTGGEVSLDQYRGRVVMLDFWATWCGPCRMTMPMLENLQKEYRNRLSLLAINLQEPDDVVRDYVRMQNLQSEILLDEKGSVGEAYGTSSIPMQVLIDKNGVVRHIQIGLGPRTIAQLRSEIDKLQHEPWDQKAAAKSL